MVFVGVKKLHEPLTKQMRVCLTSLSLIQYSEMESLGKEHHGFERGISIAKCIVDYALCDVAAKPLASDAQKFGHVFKDNQFTPNMQAVLTKLSPYNSP
jgi:hypothetical protein